MTEILELYFLPGVLVLHAFLLLPLKVALSREEHMLLLCLCHLILFSSAKGEIANFKSFFAFSATKLYFYTNEYNGMGLSSDLQTSLQLDLISIFSSVLHLSLTLTPNPLEKPNKICEAPPNSPYASL